MHSQEAEKYILFVAEEANFAVRKILIHYEEFLKVREEDYKILKECSKIINGVKTLFHRIKWNKNIGSTIQEKHTQICWTLTHYADIINHPPYYVSDNDDGDEEYIPYLDLKDKDWYEKSIKKLDGNFDCLETYNEILKMKEYDGKPIEIVDGFVVLEIDHVKNS